MGISPLRYRDFFEKGRRKDRLTGKIIRWAFGVGVPIVEIYYPVYIDLETIVRAGRGNLDRTISGISA
jgi:hypothetical protein